MFILTPIIITTFWIAVYLAGSHAVPRGPNKELFSLMLKMTAVVCWLFWAMIYLHQLNPLVGPQINARTLYWLAEKEYFLRQD